MKRGTNSILSLLFTVIFFMLGNFKEANGQHPTMYTGKRCTSDNDCVMPGFRCERVGVKDLKVDRRCVCRFNPQVDGENNTCKSNMDIHKQTYNNTHTTTYSIQHTTTTYNTYTTYNNKQIKPNAKTICGLKVKVFIVIVVVVIAIAEVIFLCLCYYIIRWYKAQLYTRGERGNLILLREVQQ